MIFLQNKSADFYCPRVIAPTVLQPELAAAASPPERSALSVGCRAGARPVRRVRRGGRFKALQSSGLGVPVE